MDSSARDSKRTAARADEAEARAEKAASDRARREALRLANVGTSASGGGGGGVSTKDILLNPSQVGGGAAGAPLGVPRP